MFETHQIHRKNIEDMHALINGCGPEDGLERERLLRLLCAIHAGALTPMSENEKRGMQRVLAILERKIGEGGGIGGPTGLQQRHNDFYRARWSAFCECAMMLRSALADEEMHEGQAGMTAHPPSDPAAEAVSALREGDERAAICRALGCLDKPGVLLKFVQDLQRRLAESYARNNELTRSWDRASPTERQELDRMRRGWGPSSPTERSRRRMDVAACVQALGGALTELSVPEEHADDVPEEAQAYLDAAHDRVGKAYEAAIAVSHAIRDDLDEWPDIRAAEERGAIAAEARADALAAALKPFVQACEDDPRRSDAHSTGVVITFGNFRAAARALKTERDSDDAA